MNSCFPADGSLPRYRPFFLHAFSLEELTVATKNFQKLLGEGGFGKVYKGMLKDPRTGGDIHVAVKKLSAESIEGEKEWLVNTTLTPLLL